MTLTKREKERQLTELTMIVTGIRLFNKECGKGGEGIDDCKYITSIHNCYVLLEFWFSSLKIWIYFHHYDSVNWLFHLSLFSACYTEWSHPSNNPECRRRDPRYIAKCIQIHSSHWGHAQRSAQGSPIHTAPEGGSDQHQAAWNIP